MRMSDWSSDVCSSDLAAVVHFIDNLIKFNLGKYRMVVGDNHQIGVGTSLVKVVVNGQIVGQFLQLAASHNRIVETNFGAFAALAQSLDHVERHRASKIVGFRPALDRKSTRLNSSH